MALVKINWRPSDRELRVFALLEMAFFALLAWFISARLHLPQSASVLLAVAVAAGGVGLLWPAFLRPLYVVWMIVVYPIGWTVSHLLMAILFYLVITPIGLIMRTCGRDPLQRKWDRSATTYWQARGEETATERYFRQF